MTGADKTLPLLLVFLALFATTVAQNSNDTVTQVPTTTTTTASTDPPTTDIPEATDLGPCTCDLTKDGCDVNCCCDDDCSADDKTAFSYCADEYLEPDGKMCVQEKIMFDAENDGRYPYTTEVTESGLFCVYTDNYEESNYYNIPDTVTSDSQFEKYSQDYGGFSFQPQPLTVTVQTTHYRSGDRIYTIYESGVLGSLGLAAPLTSGTCKDTNPAAFLYSQHHECTRVIVNLQTDCATSPTNAPFSAPTYYQSFNVISTPEAFKEFENDTEEFPDPEVNTLYNSTYSLPVQPYGHTCIDVDGLNKTCTFTDPPAPSLANGVCYNMVVKVEYLLEHNSTAGLTKVNVSFTLRDVNVTDNDLSLVSEDSVSLTQAFVTSFSKLDESNPVRRSGNPGYQLGEPLLAGIMTEETVGLEETKVYAIEVLENRDNMLTMVKSTATGTCSNDTSQRVAVTFGEGMRSGCLIRLSLDDLSGESDICNLIQEISLEALRGSKPPTHVARFGDTEPEKTGDWVQILDDYENLVGPAHSDGTCTGVVMAMHIEVVYANVGALGNAQPKVIGVKFHYHTGDVHYQCVGPYCMPGMEEATQSFEVVSSVGFVDASDPVIGVDAETPSVNARLPEDFFAPFS